MGGLYNALFGENPEALFLLETIGLVREDIARYRDVYLNEDGSKIIIYTRTGGGNREEYKDNIEFLRSCKGYVRDFDDEFDNTYAYFEFFIPEEKIEICKKKAKGEKPLNVSEKFDLEVKKMNEGDSEAIKRANDIFENFIKELKEI
jgi:hypothetical protein